MYKIVISKYEILHPKDAKLLICIPLPNKLFGLFFSDADYILYDPYTSKICKKINLGNKVYDAKILNQNFLICSICHSRQIILLNIQQGSKTTVCKLPFKQSYDKIEDDNIFFQTKYHTFKQTQSFYIQIQQEISAKIFYCTKENDYRPDPNKFKVYDLRQYMIQKFNQYGKICIYKQNPENEGTWYLKIVDLADNFTQKIYKIDHKCFDTKITVFQVRSIQNGSCLIFINGLSPTILLFNINQLKITYFKYKPIANIQEVYFFEYPLILLNLFNPSQKSFNDYLVLINIETEAAIEYVQSNLDRVKIEWNSKLLVSRQCSIKLEEKTSVKCMNIIQKRSLYIKLMECQNISEIYGQAIYEITLNLLK